MLSPPPCPRLPPFTLLCCAVFLPSSSPPSTPLLSPPPPPHLAPPLLSPLACVSVARRRGHCLPASALGEAACLASPSGGVSPTAAAAACAPASTGCAHQSGRPSLVRARGGWMLPGGGPVALCSRERAAVGCARSPSASGVSWACRWRLCWAVPSVCGGRPLRERRTVSRRCGSPCAPSLRGGGGLSPPPRTRGRFGPPLWRLPAVLWTCVS